MTPKVEQWMRDAVSKMHVKACGESCKRSDCEKDVEEATKIIASEYAKAHPPAGESAHGISDSAKKLLIEAVVKEVRSAHEDGWISVEERLPAPNSVVLFWTTDDIWESGYFRADPDEPIRWECERTAPQDERIDFYEGQVTHWMVPSAPSKEKR